MKRFIGVLVLCASVSASASVSEVYASRLADAIRLAENSRVHPYGVMSRHRLSEGEARRWCLNTIRHHYECWERGGRRGDFVSALARVYAPLGAANDPHGLNRNWVRNVSKLVK